MHRDTNGLILSAVLVDYDNIYLSLRRKSEEAAKRFSREPALWLKEIESGALITPTNDHFTPGRRRIVLNRCYGNPVPRRNAADQSTDMSSFPFVRHNFLRAGFEIIDCPPLTQQLKNSSDIRMVMDMRDYLGHETRFDEFIIVSSDADFTPLLHRLRAHNRRTAIYANDHTAPPYAAISDGEIREASLLALLLEGKLPRPGEASLPDRDVEALRSTIVGEVAQIVRQAGSAVPLETLAERATRQLGYERTAGSQWGGAGSFRDLLRDHLPADIRLTGEPPYLAYLSSRALTDEKAPALTPASSGGTRTGAPARAEPTPGLAASVPSGAGAHAERSLAPREPTPRDLATLADDARDPIGKLATRSLPPPQDHARPATSPRPDPASDEALFDQLKGGAKSPNRSTAAPARASSPAGPLASFAPSSSGPAGPAALAREALPHSAGATMLQPSPAPTGEEAIDIHRSIAKIQNASQVPPLSPPEYRVVFAVAAQEIAERGLHGKETIQSIAQRAAAEGVKLSLDDARFVLEAVGQPDPWFEQGASTSLFAGRFRNYVVQRCQTAGLSLSAKENDLIDAWFGVSGTAASRLGTTATALTGSVPAVLAPNAATASLRQRPVGDIGEDPRAIPASQAPQNDWWSGDGPVRASPGVRAPQGAAAGQAGMAQPGPVTLHAVGDELPRLFRNKIRA